MGSFSRSPYSSFIFCSKIPNDVPFNILFPSSLTPASNSSPSSFNPSRNGFESDICAPNEIFCICFVICLAVFCTAGSAPVRYENSFLLSKYSDNTSALPKCRKSLIPEKKLKILKAALWSSILPEAIFIPIIILGLIASPTDSKEMTAPKATTTSLSPP